MHTYIHTHANIIQMLPSKQTEKYSWKKCKQLFSYGESQQNKMFKYIRKKKGLTSPRVGQKNLTSFF